MTGASIGEMRRRLTIESPARGSDEAGAAATTWTAVAVVAAALKPLKAHEIVTADGVAARVTHAVEIRWRGDVTAVMRLRDGTTLYEIRGIYDADQRRRRLTCLIEELAS